MKKVILGLAVAALTSPAFAAPQSCGQLLNKKAAYASELESLREKIRSSRNGDKTEFYMDQYEDVYARYQSVVATINNNCR